jgi:predicted nucleic acid-binding protein
MSPSTWPRMRPWFRTGIRCWLRHFFARRCCPLLYQAIQRGELTKKDAERQRDYVLGMRIRLSGEPVIQRVAWQVADQLGWPDTFDAEYVALTQLEADGLITLDRRLADAVKDLVNVAPIEALF